MTAALAAVVAASCGEGSRMPTLPCGDPARFVNPRDAVLACGAQAAIAVAQGDEVTAAAAYQAHLARWPLENRFTERHLRRFLTLGYVLDPTLRNHWDSVDLGPSQVSARAAARALLAARDGDLTPAAALPPEHALCFLPLPWSIEIAARLTAGGNPRGARLSCWLAETLGEPVERQIEQTVRSADPVLARGAAQLGRDESTSPIDHVCIQVLGSLRLSRNGVAVDAPELRRGRVRQLLSAVVLHRCMTRDAAIELLWPDLDRAKAARNMRVTLTHLRRLLEPERTGCAAGAPLLRTTGDEIRLVPSAALTVDLWDSERLAGLAARARAQGDIDGAAELLRQSVALWRGDPLTDLRDLTDPAVTARIDRVRLRHLAQLLELGELELVSGCPAAAFALAEQALAAEPLDSRGHRLALAAALGTRNPLQAARARRLVCSALRELGVGPDPATAILLRQLSPAPERRQARARTRPSPARVPTG